MNLLLFTLLIAQCPNGVCPAYEWRDIPGSTSKALSVNGVQIGAWDGEHYFPYDANTRMFSQATPPPIEPPKMVGAKQAWEISGVDKSKCGKGPENSYSGVPVSQQKAYEKLQENWSIADRSDRCMIAFIDKDFAKADARRQEFMKTEVANVCNVQAYGTDDPMLKNAVDVTKIPVIPTAYILKPSGVVLARIDGNVATDKMVETVKRVNPSYDPSKDPTGNPIDILKMFSGQQLTVAGVVGVILFLFLRKPKSP